MLQAADRFGARLHLSALRPVSPSASPNLEIQRDRLFGYRNLEKGGASGQCANPSFARKGAPSEWVSVITFHPDRFTPQYKG
ncbi:hypothetical protein HFC70_11030 [Agrobacterium sp. a22-2]|uniref:hypothetical protein n=1 Tax=Agrobacterium sp. a22-2 TaxID=2283840 RepID=UPI0014451072|nr:hypothetical protein [Agrobacterium sp. a22-2]NKN36887.1 hypothetical protein [Agrobacterium sp. a22-2]